MSESGKQKKSGPSPLSGGDKISKQMLEKLEQRAAMPAPAATMSELVSGALYGTDGANLYVIDKTTGAASLVGPHGAVEIAIGAIAFDDGGSLYGISIGAAAQLYRIDSTTGSATAVGRLGLEFVFEGGLSFDAAGRLIGVDEGNALGARTFSINTSTGAATIIGPANGQDRDINGLTREGTVVYGIDRSTDSLGRLDTASGVYTQIGSTGAAVGDHGGLAMDPVDGRLYATFGSDGGFYVLDKASGNASLIAVNNVDYGLAFAPAPKKRYSYSVKFVCGVQRYDEECKPVVPGYYATEINIHNYHNREVEVRKFVLPLVSNGVVRGREPDFVDIRAKDSIVLPPNTATMDDCCRIGQLLYGQTNPAMQLTIGYLEIVSSEELAVDAVYTVSDLEQRLVRSMDVERVEARVKN